MRLLVLLAVVCLAPHAGAAGQGAGDGVIALAAGRDAPSVGDARRPGHYGVSDAR
jgi:hypothetical protein